MANFATELTALAATIVGSLAISIAMDRYKIQTEGLGNVMESPRYFGNVPHN